MYYIRAALAERLYTSINARVYVCLHKTYATRRESERAYCYYRLAYADLLVLLYNFRVAENYREKNRQ